MKKLTLEQFKEHVVDPDKQEKLLFIPALYRLCVYPNTYNSHLYRGTFNDIQGGVCAKAPASILRNNLGRGLCKVCVRVAYREYLAR